MRNISSTSLVASLWIASLGGWSSRAATYQEVGGIVVVEAEHFDSRTVDASDGHHWHLVPDDDGVDALMDSAATYGSTVFVNARGNKYMQSFPDAPGGGQNKNSAAQVGTDAVLNYKVQISTVGQYQLWVRWGGYDGSSDSLYAQIVELIDGEGVGQADWYRLGGSIGGDFSAAGGGTGWDGMTGTADAVDAGPGTDPLAWTINTAGTYTIRISQREDGSGVDSLCLQLASLPPPSPDIPESSSGPPPANLSILDFAPPRNAPAAGFNTPIRVRFFDGTTTKLDQNSVVLKLDANTVTFTKDFTNNVTTVTHQPAAFFAAKSTHTVSVDYKDNTGAAFATNWSFTVRDYLTITKDLAVTPDTTKPGFFWNVHQNTEAGQGHTLLRTERQLSGKIIGMDGNPIVNMADPNAIGTGGGADAPAQPANPVWAPITFTISRVINFSQMEGDANGAFTPDLQMPGIPSLDGSTDSIAAEIITYLELPAGAITMGVNSDDDFWTTVGQTGDVLNPPQTAGKFDGNGRGAADTIFTFVVADPGVYPFRTLYEEGGSGANIEWFTVKADRTKVLINDSTNSGIKAYRAAMPSPRAFARRVEPKPGSGGAANDAQILIELVDGNTPIPTNAVSLKLDANAVPATVTKAGNVNTITYKPPTPFGVASKHTVTLSYTEGTNTVTREWQFTTLNPYLLAYWDFNDASDPTITKDKVAAYVGRFTAGAKFTDDAKGHTAKPGDRAAKVGAADPTTPVNGVIRVDGANVASLNAGGVQDQLAVAFWQRLDEIRNSSAFWIIGEGQDRAFQAHVPWGDDKTIYFDTGGGCCDDSQRISKLLSDFPAAADPDTFVTTWHHFVFQKNGPHKQVWIDGTLFLEGTNVSALTYVFNLLTIGADNTGANNTHGDIDDFAVFATALTPTEITMLFQGTTPDKLPGRLPTVGAQPRFNALALSGTTVTLSWTGTGTLEQADTVTGSWSPAPNQNNPQTVTATGIKFYRIKQ